MMNIPNTAQLGVVVIFGISMENFSRMAVGLSLLMFLLLKESQHLHKGHMITETLLVLMVSNDKNVVVIILTMTVLDSNIPIPEAMVDTE